MWQILDDNAAMSHTQHDIMIMIEEDKCGHSSTTFFFHLSCRLAVAGQATPGIMHRTDVFEGILTDNTSVIFSPVINMRKKKSTAGSPHLPKSLKSYKTDTALPR